MSDKPSFSIIYNLETLSEAEREKYKRDVSVFFGLNPDQNWFDILWINDENTGLKKLQLYARRGTTDTLRAQRGISVLSMSQHDGPGYTSFTAVGRDANGRQEIAVGAHSTEGLKGEKLAAAISTAETRAGRRLTLKFCGLGILDHSEANTDVPISAPAYGAQLASPIPPAMSVSLPTVAVAATVPTVDNTVAEGLAEAAEVARQAQEAFEKEQKKLRDEAIAQLNAPKKQDFDHVFRGEKDSIEGPSIEAQHPDVSAGPDAPRKRGRRKKNTVDLSSPGQLPPPPIDEPKYPETAVRLVIDPLVHQAAKELIQPPAALIPVSVPLTPSQPVQAPPAPPVAPIQPILAPPVPAVVDFPGKPSKEQEEAYRAKIREYSNNVLPSAGMMPSENIGGASAKMRLFAEKMAGKPVSKMTTDDWDDFFDFFPRFLKDNSPQNLVKYINDVIGAK